MAVKYYSQLEVLAPPSTDKHVIRKLDLDNRFSEIDAMIDGINGGDLGVTPSPTRPAYTATFKVVETSGTVKTITKLSGPDLSSIDVTLYDIATGDDIDGTVQETTAGQEWTLTTTDDLTDVEYGLIVVGVA